MSLIIETLGGACPVQGHGTLNGERFYFRFRMNSAQLYVGPAASDDDDDIPDPRLYAEICGVVRGDPYLGYLDTDEAVALIHRLVDLLRPPAEWPDGTRRQRLIAWAEATFPQHQEEVS